MSYGTKARRASQPHLAQCEIPCRVPCRRHADSASRSKLAAIYGNASGFTNIVDGACGPYEGYIAGPGWNFCTGIGSPFGATNK